MHNIARSIKKKSEWLIFINNNDIFPLSMSEQAHKNTSGR